jgi:hypothetical protein
MDLLRLTDHEPPMGDFAIRPPLAFTRAVWTAPIAGEDGAPDHRIIHSRCVQFHGPATIRRIGLRRTPGYHKCGSRMDLDWVVSLRILALQDGQWVAVRCESELRQPLGDQVQWIDLGRVETTALILEVRRSGIDGWWSGWNLASGAFELDGEYQSGIAPRCERTLVLETVSKENLPDGVSLAVKHGEARYRTAHFEVAFNLRRPGFSFLSIDEWGTGRTETNVLRRQPGSFYQGVMLSPVGGPPVAAQTVRFDAEGSVSVAGNRIRYHVRLPQQDQHYQLEWTILKDRMRLCATRHSVRSVRAWSSAAWQIGLDTSVSAGHSTGEVVRAGETGSMQFPVWSHMPGFGSFAIDVLEGDALWRVNAIRPDDLITSELKLGEVLQPEGDYLLMPGHHEAVLEFRAAQPEPSLHADTPADVVRAVRSCAITALTYRADTATLSNNGVSIHCPISLDNWSAVALPMDAVIPELRAGILLRDSLERWLDGGPGYTSGPLLQDGHYYEAEDEYIMTASAGLLALAEYLETSGDSGWLDRYREPVRRRLERTKSYDVDDDGLIESIWRTGTSGSGQWSTCWLDVVSFGWKDAFANALLYPALVRLADTLPGLGGEDLSSGLLDWAEQLRQSYRPAFFNPSTGWLAGWRCKEGKLHDHAFPAINGAAVAGGLLEGEDARSMMVALLEEMERQGVPDACYGLPVSLWHIPDEDLAGIMQGYPKGYYQNAGLTHAQSRHFLAGLYRTGLVAEADLLLERLCAGAAERLVFGGSKSGVDWRAWDGSPCGYEGLLTDQFGFIGTALRRYGVPGNGSDSFTQAGHLMRYIRS